MYFELEPDHYEHDFNIDDFMTSDVILPSTIDHQRDVRTVETELESAYLDAKTRNLLKTFISPEYYGSMQELSLTGGTLVEFDSAELDIHTKKMKANLDSSSEL